ncbi:MAG TPA: DUF998 domain-containing protein [Steroidobacteraceae bacterium]|nr:DUF998 domain-containing protein [Steroidobacteraceae bacterium]
MNRLRLAAAGITANLIFWPALFIFAALRPEYSHYTKAISELGTWGAPRMWWWNTIGFMVPGALLAVFGWNFGRLVTPRGILLPVCLATLGIGFLIAGVFPGDLEHRESATTLLHMGGSFLGFGTLVGLVMLIMRIRTEWRAYSILSFFPLVGLLAIVGLHFVAPSYVHHHPGLVQRLMFANWMAWYLGAALLLLREPRAR